MKGQFLTRSSDSPLVEAVTHWIIGTDESSIAAPDGCWDLVVLKQDGQTNRRCNIASVLWERATA